MGRAGRPGFDDKGVAVIMCTDDKRDFYKKVRIETASAQNKWI